MENTPAVFDVRVHCDRFTVDIPNVYETAATQASELMVYSVTDNGARCTHTFAPGKWVYFEATEDLNLNLK